MVGRNIGEYGVKMLKNNSFFNKVGIFNSVKCYWGIKGYVKYYLNLVL